MKRRLLQLLFALGLLLTLATGGLQLRAAWQARFEVFSYEWAANDDTRVRHVVGLENSWGRLGVSWYSYEPQPPIFAMCTRLPANPLPAEAFTVPAPDPVAWWERFGFKTRPNDPFGPGLTMPLWFAVGAPAALTLAALVPLRRDRRRRRRIAHGLCVACGYDLRGAAHERCPECGTPPVAVPARV